MASRLITVQQLQKGRYDKKMHVRVMRKWYSYNAKKFREIMSMDFVGIDEKQDAIHFSVRSRFIPDFDGLIEEGSFYSIKNFIVENTRPSFRVLRRDLYVLLDASTCLEEIVANVPSINRYFFDIVPYSSLGTASVNKKYLCDIIGYVCGISEKAKRMSNNVITQMQYMDLVDLSKKKVRVTMWGNGIIDNVAAILTNGHRVLIITSTIVKVESNGEFSISNSSSSNAYYEDDIDEIKEFITCFGDELGREPMTPVPIYNTFVTKEEYEKGKTTLAAVLDKLDNGDAIKPSFYITGVIAKIHEGNGWKYNSCVTCKCKVYFIDGKLTCNYCNETVLYPIIRYRLEIDIEDDRRVVQCVMFDREVEKLIKLKASELENSDLPIPRQLSEIVGKRHILQLKYDAQQWGMYNDNFTVGRVLFDCDIVDPEKKQAEEMMGEVNVIAGLKTPSVSDKRTFVVASLIDDGCDSANNGEKTVGKGKEVRGSDMKKARKNLRF